MAITTFECNASIAEMAVEMDRRGAVIERLEAEAATREALLKEAWEVLRKAFIWTDEEKDVGEWRDAARAFLGKMEGR